MPIIDVGNDAERPSPQEGDDMTTTETPALFVVEPDGRPRLPYRVAEAEHALKLAGYVHPAHLARQETMAASWLIQWAIGTKGEDIADAGDAHAVDIFWRLLRFADVADYGDIVDDGREPTIVDALALAVRERVWDPNDTPSLARGLRALGFDRMAAAVSA